MYLRTSRFLQIFVFETLTVFNTCLLFEHIFFTNVTDYHSVFSCRMSRKLFMKKIWCLIFECTPWLFLQRVLFRFILHNVPSIEVLFGNKVKRSFFFFLHFLIMKLNGNTNCAAELISVQKLFRVNECICQEYFWKGNFKNIWHCCIIFTQLKQIFMISFLSN